MPLPLLLGLGLSAYQMFSGAQKEKKAQSSIDNYNIKDRTNVYDNMPISTVGTDLMKEQSSRLSSTAIEALRGGGARTLLSGLPRVMDKATSIDQNARKVIDDKIEKRNYAIATDDARLRDMNFQEEQADLAGLGQQLEVGRQNMFSGMRGIFNGVASGLNAGGNNPQVSTVSELSSIGLTPLSGASQLRPVVNQVGNSGIPGISPVLGEAQIAIPNLITRNNGLTFDGYPRQN